MKSSIYNFIIPTSDKEKYLLYNSSSGGLAIVDKEHKDYIENLLTRDKIDLTKLPKDIKSFLKEGHFLIDFDVDELAKIEFQNNFIKYNNKALSLTILPTLSCNFNCSYCYQSHKNKMMDKNVQEALLDFIRKNIVFGGSLSIIWFGGEPLIAKEMITDLTKRILNECDKKEVSYSSGIVTNGYLLDSGIENFLLENKISRIQVTLDGPKDIHDTRRTLIDGRGTYSKIIENLIRIKKVVSTVIRVNIDNQNYSTISKLIDDLIEYNLTEDISVYLAKVRSNSKACANFEHNCINTINFSQKEVSLYKLMLEKGLKISKYPLGNEIYCGANVLNSYVVEPNGILQKCWNTVGLDDWSVGSIYDSRIKTNKAYLEWINWTPLKFNKCRQCNILPVCFGGCSYDYFYGGNYEPDCQEWKYNLNKFLQMLYSYRLINNEK